MKKLAIICLFLCAAITVLVLFVWARPSELKHYTADELIGLTCQELGQKHEEVIFAYHDVEITHYKRTGAFHDDVGLPKVEVLPYEVLIQRFIQDNGLSGDNLLQPVSISRSSNFSSEISNICVTNPLLLAVDAMRQAAKNLNLTNDPAVP
ncbi:MAG: hypothetical protein ACI84R_000880 [Candidatus Azotimanducaceae bacterium]|jgi:hypothetical protein